MMLEGFDPGDEPEPCNKPDTQRLLRQTHEYTGNEGIPVSVFMH